MKNFGTTGIIVIAGLIIFSAGFHVVLDESGRPLSVFPKERISFAGTTVFLNELIGLYFLEKLPTYMEKQLRDRDYLRHIDKVRRLLDKSKDMYNEGAIDGEFGYSLFSMGKIPDDEMPSSDLVNNLGREAFSKWKYDNEFLGSYLAGFEKGFLYEWLRVQEELEAQKPQWKAP